MNRITKAGDDDSLPFDPDVVEISVSKHFHGTWMRKWGWHYEDVRAAIRDAHRVERTGRAKWEIYVWKKGGKKLVITYDEEGGGAYVITGAEG